MHGPVTKRRNLKSRRNRRAEGSVTVFLIMALAFVFLFTSVLIEFSRIGAAEAQARRLARSGVRSLMSAYDTELQERYGLFAYGSGEGEALISKVLDGSLTRSGRADGFQLIPLELESSTLAWSRPLANHEVFERAIQEEMKYKAPIDFALELAGKFKPMAGAMQEASRATNLYGQLEPLYERRSQALDRMAESRRQGGEQMKPILDAVSEPGRAPGGIHFGPVIRAEDVAAGYEQYFEMYYADKYRAPRTPPAYTSELLAYAGGTSRVLDRLRTAAGALETGHAESVTQAGQALAEAEAINEEMKRVITAYDESSSGAGYDSASSWDIPDGGAQAAAGTEARKLRERSEELILSDAEILALKNGLSRQESRYREAKPSIVRLPELLSPALGLNGDGQSMRSAVRLAWDEAAAYAEDYGPNGRILTGELAELERRNVSDMERKQTEKQAKAKLGDALKLVNKLRDLKDQAGASMQKYEELKAYFGQIQAMNAGGEAEAGASGLSANPYAAGDAAMGEMDQVYGTIGGILSGARDRLYQSEYAAQYYKPLEVTALSRLVRNPGTQAAEELVRHLDPAAQELEYILYGFHNPGGNLAAAFGEIFAMRLAVRTMEGLTEKAGLGNPLAVMAAALLYGVNQAVADMLKLCTDGSIELSKFVRLELTYRDHLRLFMLLHGSGKEQLSRMLALIRLNTGIDPAEKSTYVSAEMRFGMKMWFLPGLFKLLKTGDSSGKVEGNTYFTVQSADFVY
ncbi:hypothetical protein ACE6ED_11760 [Paenibacillus sp. CN-4]